MAPPNVTLTAEQVAYMTDEFNKAGATRTPTYVFDTYEASINKLATNVKAENGLKTMGERINLKNGWNEDGVDFRKAIAEAIHQTNKDWGPFGG